MLYAGFVVSLLLVAMACAWFELTPMASVVDTRLTALIAGATAAALAGWRLRRSRRVGWWCALLLGLGTASVAAVLAFGLVREDDVRFPSNGARLAGTLFLPRGSGPYPAVVFIHGAGREVRREFEYHARLFARHGIAGFVYDKRGAGESGGSTYDADYFGYASDAAAAIRYLRSRQDIAGPCVGIYGHSEGGWVASIVASQAAPDVRFVIVTSTTDLSPARQVLFETGARAGVGQAVELQKRVLQYQRSGTADPALASDLRAAARQPWFASAELPDQLYPIEEYAWWRRVMDFDAPSHWRGVRAPVLAISGGLDLNSDVRASQAGIRQALAAGGNRDFTGSIFPRMEHGGVEWWLPGRIPPPRLPFRSLLVDWTKRKTAGCQ